MVGFAGRGPANAIHDPLTATALVAETDGNRFALIACDLLQLRAEVVDEFRAAIGEMNDIAPPRIAIACSHNHYGPDVDRSDTPIVNAYRAYLKHRFAGLVLEATNGMFDAYIGVGCGSSDIGINRREKRPDGVVILGNNPDGPVDREVIVVRVDSADGRPMVCLVNFACHPVCQSGQQRAVSADYPGKMREVVELLTGATCLFFQGASGNINPIWGEHAYEPARTLGTRLGCEVVRVWETIHPEAVRVFSSASATVSLPRYRNGSQENAKRLVDALAAEIAELEAHAPNSGSLWWARLRLERVSHALESWRTGDPLPPVVAEALAWRFGQVAFVTTPGEVFNESGTFVKRRSPFRDTLFVGYTNGIIGYVPTPESYAEGGYEVTHACQVDPEAAPMLNRTCLELLERLTSS
jgi:hypothetical protein